MCPRSNETTAADSLTGGKHAVQRRVLPDQPRSQAGHHGHGRPNGLTFSPDERYLYVGDLDPRRKDRARVEWNSLTGKGDRMKAIAVFPRKPNSVHLADLPRPAVDDVPGGRGVLVKVLRVGVDGTDKEINAGEYGAAPDGDDILILGHEGFGRVEAVGPDVEQVRPGDYVVATVRRPGSSIYDLIGTNDMTTDDTYFERGINLRHGFLKEYYVDDAEYIVKVPRGVRNVGVLLESLTV